MHKSIEIQKPKRGFHESVAHVLGEYDKAVGVVLFTTTEGKLLLTERDGLWDLPSYMINGRDSAPIRIPRTVARHVLEIDPDLVEPIALIGEAVYDREFAMFVTAKLPNRVRLPGTAWVKGDPCLAALQGSVNDRVQRAIEFACREKRLMWNSGVSTLH